MASPSGSGLKSEMGTQSLATLIFFRELQLASWIVVIVQFVRLLPVSRAFDYWPAGDDGPGMGWQMFAIPLAWILAAAGAATCLWCWRRAATS